MDSAVHQYVNVDGIRTHFVVQGDGSPIVLLHGNGESLFDWSWTLPTLAKEHRVYALDMPGAGDSAKPAADYSAEVQAEFVKRFLDAIGVEQATLIGNSQGGLISLCIAIAHPERVASIVLIDSGGLGRAINPILMLHAAPVAGDLLAMWSKTWLGAKQRAWLRGWLHFASIFQVPADWLKEQERLARLPNCLEAELAVAREQSSLFGQRLVVTDQLSKVHCPVLVVWGAFDFTLPWTQAYFAALQLPCGKLAVIPNCGHMPHVERPDETLAVMLPFLAEAAGPKSVPGTH